MYTVTVAFSKELLGNIIKLPINAHIGDINDNPMYNTVIVDFSVDTNSIENANDIICKWQEDVLSVNGFKIIPKLYKG